MFEFLFAILLGLACPTHTNTTSCPTAPTNQTADDHTGGDNGQLPPPKID